jgi:hypothetical protein
MLIFKFYLNSTKMRAFFSKCQISFTNIQIKKIKLILTG